MLPSQSANSAVVRRTQNRILFADVAQYLLTIATLSNEPSISCAFQYYRRMLRPSRGPTSGTRGAATKNDQFRVESPRNFVPSTSNTSGQLPHRLHSRAKNKVDCRHHMPCTLQSWTKATAPSIIIHPSKTRHQCVKHQYIYIAVISPMRTTKKI